HRLLFADPADHADAALVDEPRYLGQADGWLHGTLYARKLCGARHRIARIPAERTAAPAEGGEVAAYRGGRCGRHSATRGASKGGGCCGRRVQDQGIDYAAQSRLLGSTRGRRGGVGLRVRGGVGPGRGRYSLRDRRLRFAGAALILGEAAVRVGTPRPSKWPRTRGW